MHPVGDGPVVVERGKDVLDGEQDVIHAPDVQEGLLLPGEGSIRQVFGRGAGAHCPGHVTAVVIRQTVVGGPDLLLESGWKGGAADQVPDLLPGQGQGGHIAAVQVLKDPFDPGVEAGPAQKTPVGVCSGGETVRDLDPGRGEVSDHFAERGVLAADLIEIGQAEVRKPKNVSHRWCSFVGHALTSAEKRCDARLGG